MPDGPAVGTRNLCDRLLEVAAADRLIVGSDVVKALALGAKAVPMSRPRIFGLALAGSVGVLRSPNAAFWPSSTSRRP
jgi:hypothetical protein